MDNRPDKKPDDPIGGGGGGAVDDLTPPTIKYGAGAANTPAPPNAGAPGTVGPVQDATIPNAPAGELTRLGATQLAPAKATRIEKPDFSGTRQHGPSATLGTHQIATVIGDVVIQDLSTEKLLSDAPKIESSGKICPSLNGIPLLAKLGQGGMGAVYYGIHPRLRSEVAVKVLPFHLAAQDPGMVQRFYREAQIAAKVRSPHLVSVIDVNEESGLFFLVMEYVAGVTMGQYIKQLAEKQMAAKEVIGMPELDAIDVILAAAMGLDAAHSNGIVHRDLKPENIMVPFKSRQNKVYDLKAAKLMDLGLARSEEAKGQLSLTGGQAAMGTPGYMAPEQAMDAKTADKRSDVFGMGATLYALLTGRPPFKGDAVMKVLMATMHEPHEPIGLLRPDISAALAEVIDHCLDKRPENRYNDAHHLIRALKNCRRLIAPDAEAEDDRDSPASSGAATTPFTPGQRVSALPNVSPGAKAGASYARAGAALSAAQSAPLQPASAKSKLPIFIGIAACGLLVLGVAAFKFLGRPAEPSDLWDKGTVALFMEDRNSEFAKAKKFAEKDPDTAQSQLTISLSSLKSARANLPKEALDKLDKEVEEVKNAITTNRGKIAFEASFPAINSLIAKENLDEAETKLKDLKPASPDQVLKVNAAKTEISDRRTAMKNKKEALSLLAESQKPGLDLAAKGTLIKKAVELDGTNPDIQEAMRSYAIAENAAKVQKDYEDNFAAAKKAWDEQKYVVAKGALRRAMIAKPGDKAAEDLSKQIAAQLTQEQRDEDARMMKQEKSQKFTEAFEKAAALLKAGKGKEAQVEIDNARMLDETNNPDLPTLALQIKQLVQKEELEIATRKKEKQYAESMATATKLKESDDIASFPLAIDTAEDAARLFPNTPKAVAAAKLKEDIITRQTELENRKKYDEDISNATRRSLNIRETNLEAAAAETDAVLKLLSEALQIAKTGKIAGKDKLDTGAAETLKKDLEAKQKRYAPLIEERKKNKQAAADAIKKGDEAAAQKNFSAALAAYQSGEPAAAALGGEDRATLFAKIAETSAKTKSIDAAIVSIDALLKDDKFDQAASQLDILSATAVDTRFAPKKAEIASAKAALETLAKKANDDAVAALKDGKFDAALNAIQTPAEAHKSRQDLVETLDALKKAQVEIESARKEGNGYDNRARVVTTPAFQEKYASRFKYMLPRIASLKEFDKLVAEKIAGELAKGGTISAAVAAALSSLKSERDVMSSKANTDLSWLETKRDEEIKASAPPPVTTNSSGNTGSTKIKDNE